MAVKWNWAASAVGGAISVCMAMTPAAAAGTDTPEAPAVKSAPADPAPAADPKSSAAKESAEKEETLVYIFSGVLTGGGETFSGTLVAAPEGPQFEVKLGKGATCDGSKLEPDKGLLRMPSTPCSDGRSMKALFVYQEGGFLRVYGTVGGEKFSTQAHALPSETADPTPAPAKPASPPADLMKRK